VQSPYWLTIFGLFGFYLIWTVQSLGLKVVGKGSAYDKSMDRFLKVGGIGMSAIVERLVRKWQKTLKRPEMMSITKSAKRRALLTFFAPVEAVILAISYFELGVSGLNLLYVFGAPLYALVFAAVIVGVRITKKVKAEVQTVIREDREPLNQPI
jgi:hypothetical protein